MKTLLILLCICLQQLAVGSPTPVDEQYLYMQALSGAVNEAIYYCD